MAATRGTGQARKVSQSKKRMIFWDGGVKFGGFMFLTNLVIGLIRESDKFFPLWPPTFPVYLHWGLNLTINPVISFASGCLFGFLMWMLKKSFEAHRIK